MTTAVQEHPADRPPVRVVRSAAVTGLAICYTGRNFGDLAQVCARSGATAIEDMFLGQRVARVFDRRTGTWPQVPVGHWVVADGCGLLVLPDVWMQVMFAADTQPQAAVLNSAVQRLVEVTGTLAELALAAVPAQPEMVPEPSEPLESPVLHRPEDFWSSTGRGFTMRRDGDVPADPWSGLGLSPVRFDGVPQAA